MALTRQLYGGGYFFQLCRVDVLAELVHRLDLKKNP
jgi:hypothetical protein